MRRGLLSLALLVFSAALISGQQTPPAAGQTPATPTFRAETRLVVHNVVVTDKDGNAIEGLTKNDFIVMENNVRQEIAFVEFQRVVPPIEKPVEPATPIAVAVPLDAVARAEAARITVPPAGDTRFQDRRLLVMYFDMTSMAQPDQLRAFDAAMKFIRTEMGPSDTMAIMALQSGSVRIRQDFTTDRPRLLEVLTTMMYNDDLDQDGIPDLDVFSSDFGQNGGEFNLFNTDRRMSALQTAVGYLRGIAQQKALIYFAGSGLSMSGGDNAAQYQATINAARKANVLVSTIDTRGLVAFSPSGNASRQSPGGMSMFNGQAAVNTMSTFAASQDSLYALAKDTGGKPLLDYNDLTVGIVNAAKTITSYYMVAYYSNNTATDGKFRRINVALADGRAGELSYRPGYYADKSWTNFTAADRDRQLEEAFMLEDPLTDMTIVMELNYFKLNSAEYYIPVSVKIPGSEQVIARKRNAARTEIDFMTEMKDCNKITYGNMRDRLVIPLTEDVAGQLASRPIQYQTGFTLLPGCYVIKLLARDTVTGRIGTFQAKFTVPNLEKEKTAVPISTVILSSQRVPIGSELFAMKTQQAKKADAVDPLIFDGQRLVPSVTRVFSKSRDLFVYLQAYEPGETTMRPLATFVSLFKGSQRVFETPPMSIDSGMDPKSKSIPMRFTVPIASLEPGDYECQVTVLDPMTQKAAFWRAAIRIVP
jgi:VWFA-related protein